MLNGEIFKMLGEKDKIKLQINGEEMEVKYVNEEVGS